jgi:hypothetical protein
MNVCVLIGHSQNTPLKPSTCDILDGHTTDMFVIFYDMASARGTVSYILYCSRMMISVT